MKAVLTLIVTAVLSVTSATAHRAANRQLQSAAAFQPGITHLTPGQRYDIQRAAEWHRGCPAALSQARVVTYRYYGFDHQDHLGQIVVNAKVAQPVASVFAKFFARRFPIRDGAFLSEYGPHRGASGDVTASFECRDAVPSPCSGGNSTHSWSMHAYGEAIDVNPRENPYVGCGMTRDKTALSYRKRSNVRPGMVTPAIYRATFGTIGWGWGGSWYGSTKDYMHFSINGH